ncbi:hypothetical protein [Pelagibacterium limicola]|uniref:hypothetical protein n=1 Tax=Pelagibacterium limicola TaxID=2791022 RepID=UPI0018AF6385|nr:hypothetical protein [Pelagibacterium limicola]
MADIDRDYPQRERTERTHYQSMSTGNSAGWWIAGLLVLAVIIIGFIAMTGGEPAPVDPAATTLETPVAPPADGAAPMTDPAPLTEPAPVTDPAAPAAPADATPVEPAPVAPAEPAPGN